MYLVSGTCTWVAPAICAVLALSLLLLLAVVEAVLVVVVVVLVVPYGRLAGDRDIAQ